MAGKAARGVQVLCCMSNMRRSQCPPHQHGLLCVQGRYFVLIPLCAEPVAYRELVPHLFVLVAGRWATRILIPGHKARRKWNSAWLGAPSVWIPEDLWLGANFSPSQFSFLAPWWFRRGGVLGWAFISGGEHELCKLLTSARVLVFLSCAVVQAAPAMT